MSVLVVRAFDELLGLGLSMHEVMEAAYQGERLTPSSCGRMDQVTALPSKPTEYRDNRCLA